MKAIAGAIVLFAGSFYALAIAWMATADNTNFVTIDGVQKLIVLFELVVLFHIFVGFCLIAFGKDEPKG